MIFLTLKAKNKFGKFQWLILKTRLNIFFFFSLLFFSGKFHKLFRLKWLHKVIANTLPLRYQPIISRNLNSSERTSPYTLSLFLLYLYFPSTNNLSVRGVERSFRPENSLTRLDECVSYVN